MPQNGPFGLRGPSREVPGAPYRKRKGSQLISRFLFWFFVVVVVENIVDS